MRRAFTIIAAVCALLSGAALMQLKLAVQNQAERVSELADQIHRDEESLRILKAEFAHLTTPQSLQQQSIENLAIMPPRPDQVIGNIGEIPFRRDSSTVSEAHSVLLPTSEASSQTDLPEEKEAEEDQTL